MSNFDDLIILAILQDLISKFGKDKILQLLNSMPDRNTTAIEQIEANNDNEWNLR